MSSLYLGPAMIPAAHSRPLRLGIVGMHIESSTFSPLLARRSDFVETRGDALLARHRYLENPDFDLFEPVPLVHFRALPGGPVARESYESMRQDILQSLADAAPIDALYYDVHGAMSVEGLLDAESCLLEDILAAVGRRIPVTCCQDLHGNVSSRLVSLVDFITCYRTAPHVDVLETRERAARLLVQWLANPCDIHRAHIRIPLLVSGEKSSTETEPARSLYESLASMAAAPGAFDVSLWMGYLWADEPRSAATVVATASDEATARALATEIAQSVWSARDEFRFIAPAGDIDWCVENALAQPQRPAFLSDAGDNPTAGGAGDIPHCLEALVRHPAFQPPASPGASALVASLPDPAAVERCVSAGSGTTVALSLGGKLDPIHGKPFETEARVIRVVPSDHEGHQDPGGVQVVIRVGGVTAILTAKRKPFHLRRDFTRLGLDPVDFDLVVVKIGYLEPELREMARHHLLVLSPGAVDPQPAPQSFHKLSRPMHPFSPPFAWAPQACLHRTDLMNFSRRD